MFIKDTDCTKDTPVILGYPDKAIYGEGIKIEPKIAGRKDSEHLKKISVTVVATGRIWSYSSAFIWRKRFSGLLL